MKLELDESLGQIFRGVKAAGAELTGLAPNKEFATNIGVETYGKETQLGGKADAMRHITFSALATKEYGETAAKTISTLNETITWNQSKAEKKMDYANDAIGIRIGKTAKTREEIVDMAKKSIESGEAKTIKDISGPYY